MKRLAERYRSWSEMGKNLFILTVVALVGALLCSIFIFLDNVGVLLGWLLGSAVNIFAYFTMAKGAANLLSQSTSPKSGYWAMLWGALRLLLYAGVLLLAGFASFKWGTLSHGYCNLISTALALLPTWITLAVTTMLRNRKEAVPPVKAKPAEEEKPAPSEEENEEEGSEQ